MKNFLIRAFREAKQKNPVPFAIFIVEIAGFLELFILASLHGNVIALLLGLLGIAIGASFMGILGDYVISSQAKLLADAMALLKRWEIVMKGKK